MSRILRNDHCVLFIITTLKKQIEALDNVAVCSRLANLFKKQISSTITSCHNSTVKNGHFLLNMQYCMEL